MEHTFQPGDPCLACLQLGMATKLRAFYINFEEQIVKCESNTCLYPYEDDLTTEKTVEANTSQQQSTSSYLADSCEQLIEQLLSDDSTATTTTSTSTTGSNPAVPDMPILNFDLSDMQLAPIDASSTAEIKPIIATEAAPSYKTEYVKKEKMDQLKPKVEIQSIETIRMPDVSEEFVDDKADVPKQCISRYFATLKANFSGAVTTLKPRQNRPNKRAPKQPRLPVVKEQTDVKQQASNTRAINANKLDDVLQVLAKSKKSTAS